MASALSYISFWEGKEIDATSIVIGKDLQDLNQKIATEFLKVLDTSIMASGRFTLALSGGSTPKSLYALLAGPEFQTQIPWPKVHLFWGDERCVPPDHPDSNYGMVHEAILSKVAIPAENVHRIEGEKDPQVAASLYEQGMRKFFAIPEGQFPRFDLILLGLGEDGHTASLFPGSEALQESKRLVAAPYVEKLGSYRLTLTLPVLNHAANIFFLVAGKDKARVLRAVLREKGGSEVVPARLVQPVQGRLIWFVVGKQLL